MRLWSLHPKYLDTRGLVALWRESLLAKAVLCEETKGYKNHPQLDRFKETSCPVLHLQKYLKGILQEAQERGYKFNSAKAGIFSCKESEIQVTYGQVEYEWKHLLAKLKLRDPQRYEELKAEKSPEVHPLFKVVPGQIGKWEKIV